MRTLTVVETSHVAGGDSDSLDEAVVSASRLTPQSLDLQSLQGYLDRQMGLQHWYLYGGGGGGGGGDESGIKGYPVDLDPHSIKDSVDYEKAWKAVFDKMSPAELKAFDAQLERDYKNAMDKFNFKLAEFLFGFKDANGNPSKMGMASSYAAQNASSFTLGLIEAALARAYAVAAALPGGI